MDFVNNWSRSITLAADALTCPIDLPDGSYRLTIADGMILGAVWEIVGAVVSDGTATLERGLEGTTPRLWEEGSLVYLTVTAGILQSLYQQIAALDARVAALEAGDPVDEPTHVLIAGEHPSQAFVGYQYPGYADYGSITPNTVSAGGSDLLIHSLNTEPTMNGQSVDIELGGVVANNLRMRIDGVMPSGTEWIELPIGGSDYTTLYIEFMDPLVSGQTYDVWIEEIV